MQISEALKLAHARAVIRQGDKFSDAMAHDLIGYAGEEFEKATRETKYYEEVIRGLADGFKLCNTVVEAIKYCDSFEKKLMEVD